MLTGAAVLTAVALIVPGWVLARIARVRGLLAVALGPALTLGVVAGLAQIYAWVHLPWRWYTAVAGFVLVGALAWLVVRWWSGRELSLAPLGRSGVVWLIGALCLAFVLQAVPIFAGMGAPGAFLQNHDALFHYSGANLMFQQAQGAQIGGLDGLYSGRSGVYYPAVWHAVVALLLPFASVPFATNALALAVCLLVWPLGVAALAQYLFPARLVVTLAVIFSAASVVFPVFTTFLIALFPFSLGLAIAPAVVAFLLLAFLPGSARGDITGPVPDGVQSISQPGGRLGPLWLLALIAAGALILVHPTGIGTVCCVVVLIVVGRIYRSKLVAWHRVGLVVAWLAVVAVVMWQASHLGFLRAMATTTARTDPATQVARVLITAGPPHIAPWWTNLAIGVLALVGVGFLLWKRRFVLPVWWLALAVLGAGANWKLPVLWGVSGLWYGSYDRIGASLVPLLAIAAAVGTAEIGRVIGAGLAGNSSDRLGAHASPQANTQITGRRQATWQTVVAGLLVIVSFGATQGFDYANKIAWVERGYNPNKLMHTAWVTPAELEAMRTLKLPADAVVLGDPTTGAGLLEVVAGINTVFNRNGLSGWDDDAKYLAAHFNEIHSNPRVCKILEDKHVDYYYADYAGSDPTDASFYGLHGTDTDKGFVKVAQLGSATLYQITACQVD